MPRIQPRRPAAGAPCSAVQGSARRDSAALGAAVRTRLLAGLLLTASASGCAVGPDYSPPARPAEAGYGTGQANDFGSAGPGEARQRLAMGQKLQADWWTRLGSPDLNRTVALALANNWSVAIARSNLEKAAEGVAAARGGLFPQVDAAAGLEQRHYGASFLGPQAFTFPTFSAYTVGPTVSYDLDVFGGTRRSIELAAADAAVQADALSAAQLSVAGDTVVEAMQIASIRAQIDVVGSVLESDQRNLTLVQTAHGAGAATQVDVTTAQSQLDRDRTTLPPLRQQLEAAQDALAILVGKSPATWTAPAFSLASMTLPQDIPLAVPSDLVRVRPDIRAAEAQLHADSAAVGIATADLYPRFTLSAGIAEEGLIGGPSGAAWSLVGGIAAPIFHGGALSARRKGAEDAYQAAFGQYQQTVLTAFQQVADTLHGLTNAADAVRTEQQALESASSALRLTRLGYGTGNAGIVQVLDAQRLQQLAELSVVQARTQRFTQTVSLFLATGGGLPDAPERTLTEQIERQKLTAAQAHAMVEPTIHTLNHGS
jgi:NodT family efflux transporter outer membrane factor (OMF) lipoprotein